MSSELVYREGGLHITTGSGSNGGKETITPKSPPSTPPPKPKKETESQKKAEKAFREREFVVEGNANVIANPDYKSNATIEVRGVGKVLSGNYYVEMVRHSWSRNGYQQTLELKSNTAGGLKPTTQPPAQKAPAREVKPSVPPKTDPPRYHIVKRGDTLWAIARKYYGNGNQFHKIANANNIKNVDLIYPGQKFLIP